MSRLLVYPQHVGLRLDQFLAAASPLSRRAARALLAEGQVARNGQVQRVASRQVELGDVIDLLSPLAPFASPVPEVHIVHQDGSLLVADKPAGVLSQPADTRQPGELAYDEQVLLALSHREGRKTFLRPVHRIDRLTSGLLLFARSPEALGPLAQAWQAQRVERLYLALVEGQPNFVETQVSAPIGRDAAHAWRFEVDPAGQAAQTEVRVLTAAHPLSLVECRLVTGRTHQVRVHLAHLGFPVAGDGLYGARLRGPARPLLHAARLALPHPATGEHLTVSSPLPEDFAPFLPPSDEVSGSVVTP